MTATARVQRVDGELHGFFSARLERPELRIGEECWVQLRVEALNGEFLVASGTDRRTGRPTPLAIDGELDGVVLIDPAPAGIGIGGPMGAVLVTAESPWEQRVLVDQFLRSADAGAGSLAGRPGLLRLRIRRPWPLARDAAAALAAGSESIVELELTGTVRPGDATAAPDIPDVPSP